MLAVRNLDRSRGLLRHVGEHLLGHRHQVVIVRVRLVELEHREFGIVLRRDAFVPEVARDLVDPLDASDRQPLQVQLGRDPEVQIHVERVVMRDKRTRHRTAGDRLHDRSLDFEIAALVEESPDGRNRPPPNLEHTPRLRVHDQIEIPLPVANLDICQPVPLLRQRQVALAEKFEPARPDRQLVGLGPEQMTRDADVVTEVEQR